jgi:hypothetical protein
MREENEGRSVILRAYKQMEYYILNYVHYYRIELDTSLTRNNLRFRQQWYNRTVIEARQLEPGEVGRTEVTLGREMNLN